MREYKREKDTLESHLREAQKKAVDHDDHIRVINTWWDQVRIFALSICWCRLIYVDSYLTKSSFLLKMRFRPMLILKVSPLTKSLDQR